MKRLIRNGERYVQASSTTFNEKLFYDRIWDELCGYACGKRVDIINIVENAIEPIMNEFGVDKFDLSQTSYQEARNQICLDVYVGKKDYVYLIYYYADDIDNDEYVEFSNDGDVEINDETTVVVDGIEDLGDEGEYL